MVVGMYNSHWSLSSDDHHNVLERHLHGLPPSFTQRVVNPDTVWPKVGRTFIPTRCLIPIGSIALVHGFLGSSRTGIKFPSNV